MVLAAACSGSPAQAGPPGGGPGKSGSAATAGAAAARLPAPVEMRGTLTPGVAAIAYSAAIVPAYPLALRAADALAYHPVAASAQAASLRSGLARSLASLAAVTAFPGVAGPAFAAYRAQARSLLAMLARPAAIAASEPARHRAALALYAFARQIGALGSALNLVPNTEPSGRH